MTHPDWWLDLRTDDGRKNSSRPSGKEKFSSFIVHRTLDTNVVLLFCHLGRDTDTDLVEPLVTAAVTLDPIHLQETKHKKFLLRMIQTDGFFWSLGFKSCYSIGDSSTQWLKSKRLLQSCCSICRLISGLSSLLHIFPQSQLSRFNLSLALLINKGQKDQKITWSFS